MRAAKLGVILENAARLAGRQVSLMTVPDNWRALAALAVNDGLRRISAEKFPMLRRVEFRRYRPTWQSNAGWTIAQECWYNGDYWRLEADASTGAPNLAGSGWRKLKMAEVAAFIEWEQPWEPVAIDRGSADITRFAYESDPRQNPSATPVRAVGMSDLGVLLESPAPKGVYVMFTPRFPQIDYKPWSDTVAYEAGDMAYLDSTKDCYQAIANIEAGGSSPAEDAEHWMPIRVSDIFEGYLTRLAASDLLTEDQGKFQTRAAADGEFEELCARYHEGIGEQRMRTGSFIRR